MSPAEVIDAAVPRLPEPLIFRVAHWLFRLALGIGMSALFLLVTAQVFARFVLNVPMPWVEELTLLFFVWVSFLGATGALLENRHLAFVMVLEWLPARLQRAVYVAGWLSVLVFLMVLGVAGFQLADLFSSYDYSTLPFSKYWFFVSVPVSALCMTPVVVFRVWRAIRGAPIVLQTG